MPLTTPRRLQLRTCIVAIALCIAGGGLFGLLVSGLNWIGLPRGALTGLLIGTPIVAFEMYVVRGRAGLGLRQLPLWRFLAIKIVAYAAVIVAGDRLAFAAFSPWIDRPEGAVWLGLLSSFSFSVAAALVINAFFLMQQMLGPGALSDLLLGRYHRPREEEVIFLFLDLVGSTAIAERIGPVRFHTLLNRFVFDMTGPLLAHGGSIYRYVGDEVIATWPLGPPARNRRSIDAFHACAAALDAAAADYRERFGVVPAFRAALHAGPVVAGEMGDWKREITYLGDVVNTAARIEQKCKELGEACLVSGDLAARLPVEVTGSLRPLGPLALAGKAEPILLCALDRGAPGGG